MFPTDGCGCRWCGEAARADRRRAVRILVALAVAVFASIAVWR